MSKPEPKFTTGQSVIVYTYPDGTADTATVRCVLAVRGYGGRTIFDYTTTWGRYSERQLRAAA